MEKPEWLTTAARGTPSRGLSSKYGVFSIQELTKEVDGCHASGMKMGAIKSGHVVSPSIAKDRR